MSSRKQLVNVAAGVLGSFDSRNNDIEGYWAIGKLYLFALEHRCTEVRIDLLTGQIVPLIEGQENYLRSQVLLFKERLRQMAFSDYSIQKAYVLLRFSLSYEDASALPITINKRPISFIDGKPYRLSVCIEDDLGRQRSATTFGVCWPHDPKREQQSTRADR